MFLPMFTFIAVFGLTPNYHLLWPLPAYLGLTVLMAGIMVQDTNRVVRFYRTRAPWIAGGALAALGLTVVLGSYGIPGIPHAQEIYGWDDVAQRARQERQKLPAGSFYLAVGGRPYPFPSQLALRLADPEEVHSSALLGLDVLNYRYWDHPEQLLGKAAVLVMEDGMQNPAMQAIVARSFQTVEAAGEVKVAVGKFPWIRQRSVRFLIYRGYGYRGPQNDPVVHKTNRENDQRGRSAAGSASAAPAAWLPRNECTASCCPKRS
jgi:hypothetical protein